MDEEHNSYLEIGESFEQTLNSLITVCFRLYFKELQRPVEKRNEELKTSFYNQFREVSRVKNSYLFSDIAAKQELILKYGPELRKLIEIEIRDYL